MANSNKFGGAYKATFTPPGSGSTALDLGSTSAGFLMTYNILHAPFGEDFFGQVATIGSILKGADVSITLVGLDWSLISQVAFTAVGGINNIGSPFQYVGRDGHDLAGTLTLVPFLTSYATNLPALTPTSVSFNFALPLGPQEINLDSNLRMLGLYCQCFPDYTTGDIFTWTA